MSEAFDPRALRNAFGAFATGVTVVTTRTGEGAPIGFTANSFASVSLDPPLLLICLARSSRNFEHLTRAAGFAVNILSEDQQDISNTFARPVEDRFASVDWRDGPVGSPVFPLAAAWFDCTSERIVEAGDHVILIGRVGGFESSERNGLGYVRGSYFSPALGARALKAATSHECTVSAVVERDGAVLLVTDEEGRLALPRTSTEGGDPVEALETQLEARTGLRVKAGFLFSVYEDRATGRQNIVYRAGADAGEPAEGQFVPMSEIPMDRLTAPEATVVRRFVAESSIGTFGVYVGNEAVGRVHALARKG